ncbi:HAMP domain-containing histidine kinase [Petralouisia muris]|uniref:HAMP domain-containing histidine kinase n=1 Tax=Petralouisia muris TaxID=3032872 RepID=A0AC61S213_9FIRM|nr:HAMP domain-containing sensor histidine kinase [Petralouisia muris]TGY97974.1 HAMP domain-containing histidine kinase [Petralouisia muris]
MKKINQLLLAVLLGGLGVLCFVNLLLSQTELSGNDREYRISLNRLEQSVEDFEKETGRAAESLEELAAFAKAENYPFVTGLSVLARESEEGQESEAFWRNGESEYAVIAARLAYYKVYYVSGKISDGSVRVLVNSLAVFFLLLTLSVLWYVRQKILLPFTRLIRLPYELSKGNLTIPLEENKDRFFGKFMWGMDLLRESLEENKARELELLKEKKVLLLSLSHDIKTPLSAIHLYAQALYKNLYQEESKKQEVAEKIKEKADEIESCIGEIVKASNEDFLSFQVENREIYVKAVLEQIRLYYEEKMALYQLEFKMESYSNCLVWGDGDRMTEVMQNVIENAIKYGDGRKIGISAWREEEEYVITVQNTGCSLAEKELPHIFDSFFRGSNVGKNPGSGLGLYICRQLMHLMEGEITAGIREKDGEPWMEICLTLHLA